MPPILLSCHNVMYPPKTGVRNDEPSLSTLNDKYQSQRCKRERKCHAKLRGISVRGGIITFIANESNRFHFSG